LFHTLRLVIGSSDEKEIQKVSNHLYFSILCPIDRYFKPSYESEKKLISILSGPTMP